MLAIFKKLTGGTATAEELKGALAALDIEGADKAVTRAESARRDAILQGDDGAVTRAEQALVKARLERERIAIASDELTKRLAEAEKAEADQRLDRVRVDAERFRDQVRARMKRDLVPALRTACDVLQAVVAADEAIKTANAELVSAGRPPLQGVEDGFTPTPENQYGPLHHVGANVRIPRLDGWNVPGFGWTEPTFPLAKMIEGAFPPGAVGSKGEAPRAVVLRPASAGGWSHSE